MLIFSATRSTFYKTWQGIKLIQLLSIFTAKKVWKFLIKIQLTKFDPKRTRGWKVPCLMPIRFKKYGISFMKSSTSISTFTKSFQLRKLREEIKSHSQIFRHGWSIFCLPHRPTFSDFFDLCLHWVSVVCACNQSKSLVFFEKSVILLHNSLSIGFNSSFLKLVQCQSQLNHEIQPFQHKNLRTI